MLNQAGGAKMETMLKLVLIFFVSLLSFAVGTFVGKGVSDSEYREAKLENRDYKEFREPASEHGEKAAGLNEEDVNNLTEEFLKDEAAGDKKPAAHDDKHEEKPAHETAAHEEKPTTTPDGYRKVAATVKEAAQAAATAVTGHAPNPAPAAAPSKAAARIAEGHAPAKELPQARKPNTVLPNLAAGSIGKYTVQIASYPSEEEATRHVTELKGKGFPAFYVNAKVNNKKWYRVSVGVYETFASANSHSAEIAKGTSAKTTVVQKIVE